MKLTVISKADWLLLCFSIVFQCAAAIAIKYGSSAIRLQGLSGSEIILANPAYLLSLLFLGLQALSWQLVIQRIPLNQAYFFNSGLYILLLIASHTFFDEPVTPGNILGTIVIVIGIVLLVRASSSKEEIQ